MSERELFKKEFIQKNNLNSYESYELKSDASFRKYTRYIKDNGSLIVMDCPPDKENLPNYIKTNEILKNSGFSVPDIHESDTKNGFALIQDFGDTSFKNVLNKEFEGVEFPDEMRLYERAVDALIKMHQEIPKNLDLPVYNDKMLVDESSLFIEWYLTVLNGEKLSKQEQNDFIIILKDLLKHTKDFQKVFVHRDYHAENLFWLPEEQGIRRIGIIDFQDAVYGSPIYDLVSLLEDARREVSKTVVEAMITKYLKAFPQYSRKDFLASYSILSLQRNLKIVGIFTRQAAKYKRSEYLKYLSRVWGYINGSLRHPLLLPMKNWLDIHIPSRIHNLYGTAKLVTG